MDLPIGRHGTWDTMFAEGKRLLALVCWTGYVDARSSGGTISPHDGKSPKTSSLLKLYKTKLNFK